MLEQEYNIEVDKMDRPLGFRPRKDFYSGKYIHRACQLLLFNSKNELLLQKRAASKIWYPNLYTFSVSGTVTKGSYQESMAQEIKEEIGITIQVKEKFKFPYFDTINKAWHMVFEGLSDDKLFPDADEIQELKWVSLDYLKKDIFDKPYLYTPPFKYGFKRFLETL